MEVIFKKEYSANKLKDMINRLPEHSERLNELYERVVLKKLFN